MKINSTNDAKPGMAGVAGGVAAGFIVCLCILLMAGCDTGFEPVEPPPTRAPDHAPPVEPQPEEENAFEPVPPPDFPDTPDEPYPVHPPGDPVSENDE